MKSLLAASLIKWMPMLQKYEMTISFKCKKSKQDVPIIHYTKQVSSHESAFADVRDDFMPWLYATIALQIVEEKS